jgi:hypothetical protein
MLAYAEDAQLRGLLQAAASASVAFFERRLSSRAAAADAEGAEKVRE